jgi:hypothetical protein
VAGLGNAWWPRLRKVKPAREKIHAERGLTMYPLLGAQKFVLPMNRKWSLQPERQYRFRWNLYRAAMSEKLIAERSSAANTCSDGSTLAAALPVSEA